MYLLYTDTGVKQLTMCIDSQELAEWHENHLPTNQVQEGGDNEEF